MKSTFRSLLVVGAAAALALPVAPAALANVPVTSLRAIQPTEGSPGLEIKRKGVLKPGEVRENVKFKADRGKLDLTISQKGNCRVLKVRIDTPGSNQELEKKLKNKDRRWKISVSVGSAGKVKVKLRKGGKNKQDCTSTWQLSASQPAVVVG